MKWHDEQEPVPNAPEDASDLVEMERLAREAGAPLPLREWVALAESWRIAQALREARGNRSAAARALGIGRRTLYSKMTRLGLEPTWRMPRRRNGSAPGTARE